MVQNEAMSLDDHQLSPFFKDADEYSNLSQKRHFRQLRGQLAFLLLAAIAGAFTLRWDGGADWAGVVGAVAFGCALLLRLYAEIQQDERKWYESRAAAESAKTLCWRFAVGGNPFPVTISDDEAKRILVERFHDIGRELHYVKVAKSATPEGEATARMLELRNHPQSMRSASYARYRVQAQQSWYADKASTNERWSRTWLVIVLIAEGVGLAGAILKASGVLDVDLLGIFSAVAAAAGAWLQARQHRTIAAAYSVTARELRQIASLVKDDASIDDWPDFVDQAEEAISREHTMWVASRTGHRPLAAN